MELPPLSLYVHLPWCVRKCPYCDFNSHALKGELPQDEYVGALLKDLEEDLPLVWGRPVHSIFLGGGTPSLFSAGQIDALLCGIRSRIPLSPEAEITLESNPGTVEHDSFSAYRAAGVNRISLGVQSFDDRCLAELGRIHGADEAQRAVAAIHRAGIGNFNIDLMYGLPGQSIESARQDVRAAIACRPTHISYYQLTIEPNTEFHVRPPVLPDEDQSWRIQNQAVKLLAQAGYEQYEISAWSRPGFRCRHNLNYWRYGDFLGIGAGAHGKISVPAENSVRRRIRQRHPVGWMKAVAGGTAVVQDRRPGADERVFEFFLNQLRLRGGVSKNQLKPRTGVDWSAVSDRVRQAVDKGLVTEENDRLMPTELGWRFINDIQAIFLP